MRTAERLTGLKKWVEKILCEDLGYIPVFEKGTATLQNTKVKNLGIKPVGVPYTFEYVSK